MSFDLSRAPGGGLENSEQGSDEKFGAWNKRGSCIFGTAEIVQGPHWKSSGKEGFES